MKRLSRIPSTVLMVVLAIGQSAAVEGQSTPVAGGALEFTTAATWDASSIPGLSIPMGMDVASDGQVYVTNAGTNEIIVLDADGSLVRRWGGTGEGEGQFDFWKDPGDPWNGGVAVGSDGTVYVADAGNQRVQAFDAEGAFLRQWGSSGTGEGQFLEAMDLAVAPDGTVYVVDDLRDVIQRFTPDGAYVGTLGGHGTGDGQLNYTGSVFVDAAGTLYSADWDNNRVQAWDEHGAFLWTLGSHGSDPGQFTLPGDVGVDGEGNLYVADRHRVQVFGPDRSPLGVWIAPGLGEDDEIYAVTVGPDGSVYVGGPWNDRIYRLRAPMSPAETANPG